MLARLGRVLKEKAAGDFDRFFKGAGKTRERLGVSGSHAWRLPAYQGMLSSHGYRAAALACGARGWQVHRVRRDVHAAMHAHAPRCGSAHMQRLLLHSDCFHLGRTCICVHGVGGG